MKADHELNLKSGTSDVIKITIDGISFFVLVQNFIAQYADMVTPIFKDGKFVGTECVFPPSLQGKVF